MDNNKYTLRDLHDVHYYCPVFKKATMDFKTFSLSAFELHSQYVKLKGHSNDFTHEEFSLLFIESATKSVKKVA